VAQQYKRKTILKTSKAFPTLLKRLHVTSKDEIILTPIENAIETINGRKDALQTELGRSPPNTKLLQINLQGAVLARMY
jgi:dedicator of cytokinesis protein 6/7/8